MKIEEKANCAEITFLGDEPYGIGKDAMLEHYGVDADVTITLTEKGILVNEELIDWITINQLRDNLRARRGVEEK